ncbi:hypothetical protein [Chromatocurvus halotolerans]|uniref:D-glycerate 3-kinase n=1 Tax=Chromatocurvus halotolerans TaxID=1132028 RepID=A0A4R2KUU5_9GAMM|nr:hypothetical protein [Chromatocurvus halotolerans]TCO74916.1 D-glycerate 3-kinase [Chromatocurvus halotolerans]
MAEESAADASLAPWQRDFLKRQQLPVAYLDSAARWFDPLALRLRDLAAVSAHPLLVGVNGCQGSGKSTLCDYLATRLAAHDGCNTVALSLDDFYLTLEARRSLAAEVHPLLVTRGVPGTHDMPLLRRTLQALQAVGRDQTRGDDGTASQAARVNADDGKRDSVAIPRFDKGADDRFPAAQWDRISGPVDIILLEGWCLGARPVSVVEPPLNALEATEDPDGSWRRHINAVLAADFLPLYRQIDLWVMLCAPDVDCVYRWRLEQEQKLSLARSGAGEGTGNGTGIMSEPQLARFIQHYERLTRHCLESLPGRVDILYRLDGSRAVSSIAGDLHGATQAGPVVGT